MLYVIKTEFSDECVLNLNKFGKLQHLIHTGFYSIPGTLKYRVLYKKNNTYFTIKIFLSSKYYFT